MQALFKVNCIQDLYFIRLANDFPILVHDWFCNHVPALVHDRFPVLTEDGPQLRSASLQQFTALNQDCSLWVLSTRTQENLHLIFRGFIIRVIFNQP